MAVILDRLALGRIKPEDPHETFIACPYCGYRIKVVSFALSSDDVENAARSASGNALFICACGRITETVVSQNVIYLERAMRL